MLSTKGPMTETVSRKIPEWLRRPWAWRVTVFLVVGGLLWAGWYVNERGFTKKWRGYLKQEFAKRGMDIEFERLTLDPFRGLVARDVRFISSRESQGGGSTGTIGQVALDVNYASLIRGREFLNAADLRDTELIIPLGDGHDPLVVTNLSARIFFPDDEILIRQLQADFHDVRVHGEFRFFHYQSAESPGEQTELPEDQNWFAGGESASDPAEPEPFSLRLSEELLEFFRVIDAEASKIVATGSRRPIVNIRLESDLATSRLINSEISVSGTNFQRGETQFDKAEAALWLRDGQLTLKHALLQRGPERLQASGSIDLETLRGRFRMDSETQVRELLREYARHPLMREFVFYDAPHISAAGELDLRSETPVSLLGSFESGRTLFRSVLFERVRADFSWQASDRWMIHDMQLAHRDGSATVSARMLPGDFRARAVCKMAGEAVAPILGAAASQFLKDWEFLDPPRIMLNVRGDSLDIPDLTYSGSLDVSRARFRGKWIKRAGASIAGDYATIEYRDFHLVREEGEARGTVSYPLANPHRVQFHNVRSTIHLLDGASWFGEGISEALAPYRFHAPPKLSIEGTADFSDAPETDLQIRLQAPEGFTWKFFDRDLQFTDVEALLFLKEGQLGIRNARGNVLQGDAELNLLVDLVDSHNTGYAGRLTLAGVEFTPFARFIWPDSDLPDATLGGILHFQNSTNEREDFEASGVVEVEGAGLLALPLFGEISGTLRTFAGNLRGQTQDHKEQPYLISRFTFQDNLLRTQAMEGGAGDLLFEGTGTFGVEDNQMDLILKGRTHTMEEGLLSPFSDLLSFRGTGTPQDPQWRLERFVPPPTETAHPTEVEVDPPPPTPRLNRPARQMPRNITRP